MKRWLGSFMLVAAGIILPVAVAADEPQEKDAIKESATEAKAAETETPILRMTELRLDEYVVPARMINLPIPGKTRTLQDVLDRMKEWSEDEKVGAVLLDVGFLSLSLPDIEELRTGLEGLRAAKKKVFAFLNASTPAGYLLASGADEVAMAPTSGMIIPGLGGVVPFMKGHYQMLGLEFDVITAGEYKYGGFITERQPNKYFLEEYDAILDSMFGDYVGMIARGRKLSEDQVRDAINMALLKADEAQQRGLVDTLAYYDDYRDQLLRRERMKRYHGDEDGLAHINTIQDLVEAINEAMQKAAEAQKAVGPKIAVLHARGPIVDFNMGAGFASMLICRDDFGKVIDELRKNDSIKAVVMRIDSPGGSGYASDVIWQKLRELDRAKPLVVSQGQVAGSGGYYLSCPGRRIFAQPTTITGSIGVIGMFQCAWSMFNRMDYELYPLERGKRVLMGSPTRELAKEDRAFIQKYIDDFYDVFIDRVAVTRKMPASEVRKVAGGRIWSGRDAVKIGLVDELGGMPEAIEAARRFANIPPSAELKIVHYPRPASFGEVLESMSGVGTSEMMEMFTKGVNAAKPMTLQQQLLLFSQRLQPLCWMPVPEIFQPQAAPELPTFQPVGTPQTGNGLEQILRIGR